MQLTREPEKGHRHLRTALMPIGDDMALMPALMFQRIMRLLGANLPGTIKEGLLVEIRNASSRVARHD